MRFLILAAAVLAGGAAAGVPGDGKPDAVRAASVTVELDDGSGSGVVFKNGEHSFVWTAAHVVAGGQKARTVFDPKSGAPAVAVTYADVNVCTEDFQGGRKVGETHRLAKVVRFGSDDDLAVLMVYEKGYGKASTSFKSGAPAVGAPIWHVGSFHGGSGRGSLAEGIVSAVGRLRATTGGPSDTKSPVVCDQVSVVAHPGSSGGGVFLKDSGECVGLVSTFLSIKSPYITYNSFCVVPSRRIHEFAKRTGCEWALDKNVKVPGLDEIMAGRVTDVPVELPKDFPVPAPAPVPPKK